MTEPSASNLQSKMQALLDAVERQREELAKSKEQVLIRFEAALDYRFLHARDHPAVQCHRQMVARTIELARACGVPEDEIEGMADGARIHDLGLVMLPDLVLFPGPFRSDEIQTQYEQHVQLAMQTMADAKFLTQGGRDIIAGHHERWDGTGYPAALAGEAIPFAARLFAVVESYEVAVHATSDLEAQAFLRAEAGIGLDPELVGRLLTLL